MCGLVALVSPLQPLQPQALRAAVATLARRGPDGEGLWLSPDGCRLYLSQENAPGGRGGADLFVASRPP